MTVGMVQSQAQQIKVLFEAQGREKIFPDQIGIYSELPSPFLRLILPLIA